MSDHTPDARPSEAGYQPDPAAEVRMLIDAFFAALAEAIPERHDDLIWRLRAGHERLLADQGHRVIDEASGHNLALSLAVLTGYQELSGRFGDAELLPLLRTAFVEPMRATVQQATAAALDAAADPFAAMVEISRLRERYAFGAGFTFTHPRDDDSHYVAQVERCYYHDVLSANGAAHLTPVFCAFDSNWIDVIHPERHGFTFDRPTTIGTGGQNCPFRFRRTRTPTER
ncbi:L-2-amino-thiazoline-4-carboxylic acid hydrolase [Sphaerisporangium sp. NPDC005288]|uniref:L-2-amino-thiazoline-4-carboxylic acid hydrolase n=1 Tax=Sphaerisporangium sp. NPDC005288 TaxID=3155114 RepID=UPI0033A8F217